jgi:protein SCO1/2
MVGTNPEETVRLRITTYAAIIALAVVGLVSPASAQPDRERLERVDVEEHLGDKVDEDLTFTRHDGEEVSLSHYFRDDKPVILTLNYYNCPMLCSLQLNGLIDGIQELGWKPGNDYRIVTISISPDETADLASAKRDAYLEELGMGDNVEWDFLVGSEENIEQVAENVGFQYEWVPDLEEYAHPAALFMLSPSGKITRYLYGLEYRAFDLRMGILEAGEGKVGSTVDKVILSCFHYDPDRNSYAPFAFGLVRAGGVLTLLLLGGGLVIMWLREIKNRLSEE